MAVLKFVVSKAGAVTIEVSGTTGANCEELTRAFEDALGVKTDIQYKPDYYCELEGTEVKNYEGEE